MSKIILRTFYVQMEKKCFLECSIFTFSKSKSNKIVQTQNNDLYKVIIKYFTFSSY